eukprot:4220602-Karenia_brevis.AAC.1
MPTSTTSAATSTSSANTTSTSSATAGDAQLGAVQRVAVTAAELPATWQGSRPGGTAMAIRPS